MRVLTMLDEGVQPNETTVPMLPCVAPEETLAFWRALGFAVTYEQTKPYLYLAVRWRGFEPNLREGACQRATSD